LSFFDRGVVPYFQHLWGSEPIHWLFPKSSFLEIEKGPLENQRGFKGSKKR